jgi:hypothetical protein
MGLKDLAYVVGLAIALFALIWFIFWVLQHLI